jgi:hypothetical protein
VGGRCRFSVVPCVACNNLFIENNLYSWGLLCPTVNDLFCYIFYYVSFYIVLFERGLLCPTVNLFLYIFYFVSFYICSIV